MSLSATAGAAAASGSSAVGFHPHGHKRGVLDDSSTESSSPATTEGLFSSLLSTIAQVAVGTNPLASVAISALTSAAPASSAASTTDGSSTGSSTLGGNIDAKA